MSPEKKLPINVLIVDDSYFMRKILQELLSDSPEVINVVDVAKNGFEAIEKTRKIKPDVITMDVEMPRMDGLEALKVIMREMPTPIIMLSSHTEKGSDTAIRSLELGAVDCIAKPVEKVLENIKSIQEELIEKIKSASVSRSRFNGILYSENGIESNVKDQKLNLNSVNKNIKNERPATFIVAVASSTGGPRALNEFFSHIKPDASFAFVVVQHMSPGFTKALARRLGEVCPLEVSEAAENTILKSGSVYIAPGGIHIIIKGISGSFHFAYDDSPPRLGVKPSADIMMNSVAKAASKKCIGVVLTGMGRDGTMGLKSIKSAGGNTFAQDAESCVVYGMPKSAVEANVIDQQLPIMKIANEINSFLNGQYKS